MTRSIPRRWTGPAAAGPWRARAARAPITGAALVALTLAAARAPAGEPPPSPAPSEAPVAAPAAEAPPKVTLKWTTASEVDNYGYFVYRGDAEEGPFTKMNEKAIPGAGNADTPTNYVWEDHNVELGKTYYYYLEAVSVQGLREKFSPVLSKKCCGKAAEPAPEPAKPGDAKP